MKKVLSILLVILNMASVSAQVLPGKCQIGLPRVLLKGSVMKESLTVELLQSTDWGQKTKVGKHWTVFSDRSSNVTYTEPRKNSSPYGKLKFSEELRIAEIKNGFALVYYEPYPNTTYPLISDKAECRGWVPMERLLLWTSCLANEKGIYYKALLCNNVDVKASVSGRGFTNPTTKEGKFQLKSEEIFFIMKREGDMVLLARQHTLGDDAISKRLEGWVSQESYVPWNQRSCLEPTWSHEDVEYFASKKIASYVYDKSGFKALTMPFKKSMEPYSEYQYRMDPYEFRYPILDGSTADTYECSSFYSAGGGRAGSSGSERQRRLEEKKKIRFIIVMDGTKSMDKYAKSVFQAVKEGCEYFNKNYEIRVGALLYRDYTEGKNIVEYCRLKKPTDPELLNFLEHGGTYGYKSASSDHTDTEAVFYGINQALELFKLDTLQSNVMLVIGDCGNHERDRDKLSPQILAHKLAEQRVELISFQVCNKNSQAWNSFNTQLVQMIKFSLQEKYSSIDDNRSIKDGIKVTATTAPKGIGYDFGPTIAVDNDLYFGAHRYAARGTSIAASELQNLMTNTIRNYQQSIQHQIDLIAYGRSSVESESTSEFISKEAAHNSYVIDSLFLAKILGQGGGFVGFRGYTKKQDAASGRDFYKPVLFISSEEFDELMKQLAPVAMAAEESNATNRQPYIKAVKSLLKAMAPGLTNAELDKKSISDVMTMLEGLNAASASTGQGQYTLLQIADPFAVKNAKFLGILNDFKKKYDKLSRMKNSRYEYAKEFNGAKYYWIPIEDLP